MIASLFGMLNQLLPAVVLTAVLGMLIVRREARPARVLVRRPDSAGRRKRLR